MVERERKTGKEHFIAKPSLIIISFTCVKALQCWRRVRSLKKKFCFFKGKGGGDNKIWEKVIIIIINWLKNAIY